LGGAGFNFLVAVVLHLVTSDGEEVVFPVLSWVLVAGPPDQEVCVLVLVILWSEALVLSVLDLGIAVASNLALIACELSHGNFLAQSLLRSVLG